jgi:hypothetical protein
MKPKNVKEFQALIERYESITLKEIDEQYDETMTGHYNARYFTGFGTFATCSLCEATNGKGEYGYRNCEYCVYNDVSLCNNDNYGCNSQVNEKSYDKIDKASTPKELLKAFRARAKHLRKTYPQYLTK